MAIINIITIVREASSIQKIKSIIANQTTARIARKTSRRTCGSSSFDACAIGCYIIVCIADGARIILITSLTAENSAVDRLTIWN
mgnify:FL=1